jgi:tetraacyldisaccharide 4'-kinase
MSESETDHAAPVRHVLRPLAAAYGLAARVRAAAYRHGWLARRSLSVPVISVGNLTVGGTGKTPVVIWVVQRLLATGRRVAVLSRGYRRQSTASRLLVSDGRQLLARPNEAGDEPYLIAERCGGAIVAVGADRYETGRWVLDRQPVDCVVLDDGFQHVALKRDVDLLLVDSSDPHGLDALLPAGRLREPLSAAARSTALLLTRADNVAEVKAVWDRLRPHLEAGRPAIRVLFRMDKLIELGTGTIYEPATVAGRVGFAFSGIAKARSFRSLLERYGVKVAGDIVFRDHHHYSSENMAQIRLAAMRCGAELILTTEKDAVKVTPLLAHDDKILAVRLSCDIVEGADQLEWLILGAVEKR